MSTSVATGGFAPTLDAFACSIEAVHNSDSSSVLTPESRGHRSVTRHEASLKFNEKVHGADAQISHSDAFGLASGTGFIGFPAFSLVRQDFPALDSRIELFILRVLFAGLKSSKRVRLGDVLDDIVDNSKESSVTDINKQTFFDFLSGF